ncbi:MAG: reverse transcriptase family protein, partial [Pirellulales bacterium]
MQSQVSLAQPEIFSLTSTRIPPRTEVVLPCGVVGGHEHTDYLFEPISSYFSELGLHAAPALVHVNAGTIPVRILNPHRHSVRLYEFATLGHLECLPNETVVYRIDTSNVETTTISSGNRKSRYSFKLDDTSLSETEKPIFQNFLADNDDIFALDDSELSQCPYVKHPINTGQAPPIKQRAYRIPICERAKLKTHIDGMLQNKIIRPSTSPWASPVVLVKKKNGLDRFCVDYRKVNRVTKRDVYPLPRIDDILDSVGKSKYFSTLDLRAGYWQVGVADEDKEKTAFTTFYGLYEFNVLPFGLSSAPSTFQRLM